MLAAALSAVLAAAVFVFTKGEVSFGPSGTGSTVADARDRDGGNAVNPSESPSSQTSERSAALDTASPIDDGRVEAPAPEINTASDHTPSTEDIREGEETEGDDTESAAGSVTPGLSALRSLGDPLPPAPSLPGAPPPPTESRLGSREAEPASADPSRQAELSVAEATALNAQPDFRCPDSERDGDVRLQLPLGEGSEEPSIVDLAEAAAFGKAASRCVDALVTVIGYSSAGENPLEEAVAGLKRARAFVERLQSLDVDVSEFEVFAAPQDEATDAMRDGVEIIVK
ncbi:MAG: hypothetical protein AAF526_04390 [Pseudomonadota bacterium]